MIETFLLLIILLLNSILMYHVDFDTQDEYEYDQDSDSTDLDVSFGLDANGVPILPTTIPHVPAPAVDSGDTIPFDTAVAMVTTTPVEDPVIEPSTPTSVQSPLVAILNKANKETTVVTVTTPIIMAPVSLLSSLRDTLDPAECEEAFLDIIKQNLINNLDYISKDVLAVILGTTTNPADTITKKDNLEKDTDLTLAIEDNSTPTITIKENTASTTLEDDNNTSTIVED